MKPSFNEKLIVYLTLISGLSISAVAVYYSVAGLTAIFAAAVIPIIVMGVTLEISKLVATVWLKQNWSIAPLTIKIYLCIAIAILMLITSLGIFGFLSKAHSDQSLISGDVLSKIAIYDERIKTAKENIEADRRQLKQMDEAVDQVMARSTTEQGADKSNAIRKAQARDRSALAKNIETNQKLIAALNNESALIRAEVRKIEAEVGPLKYIAAFVYGETDKTVLEKAVTWVIIILVLVFDPLAVVLLLASQFSFQHFKDRKTIKEPMEGNSPEKESDVIGTATVTNVKFSDDNIKNAFVQKQLEKIWQAINHPCEKCGTTMTYAPDTGIICPNSECNKQESKTDETIVLDEKDNQLKESPKNFNLNDYPYLFKVPENKHPPGIELVGPQVYKAESILTDQDKIEEIVKSIETNVEQLYNQNEETIESNESSRIVNTESKVDEIIKLEDNNETMIQKPSLTKRLKEKLAKEREEKISYYVRQVKEGRIDHSQVPGDVFSEVKSRV